jgi:hypothetical protein
LDTAGCKLQPTIKPEVKNVMCVSKKREFQGFFALIPELLPIDDKINRIESSIHFLNETDL